MREHYAVYIDYGKLGIQATPDPFRDTREQVVSDIAEGQYRSEVYAVLRIAVGEPCDDVTEDILSEAWAVARDDGSELAPYIMDNIMDNLEAYRKRKRQEAEAERGLAREAANA